MEINKMAEKAFMEYSMEVIKQRALPSVEDGCKPIHRRILYSMKDGGYLSNKPTRKCAKIVGEVMGRLHPHGDSSIYDALVRLAQPWKMRYPLIEIQGNMGNILGDKQAASRYTECRLTPIGELMTKDINKNCVPTELNYSGEEQEPVILTSEFPNVLVNPNLGIAVGMSSTTVSHNLKEVCDAVVAYIRNEGKLTTEQLLQYIKGPDFPTGGTIVNGGDIAKIYETGKGSIKLRSKFTVEVINGRPNIIIKEVPYLISIEDKIILKIKSMVIEDGYQGIENIQNNTGKDGFEIRIICAKDANVNKIIKDLCESTGFQNNISVNNTVLVNGVPKFLSYVDMIEQYLKFRHNVLIAIAKYDKNKAQARLHILEGLLIALNDIDNVIAIIKTSISKDDARKKLINAYNFSIDQTNSILDMKLSKLTSMETEEIKIEQTEIVIEIAKLNTIIENTNKARDIVIINQLLSIKNKFGDARKTEISSIIEQQSKTETKEIIHLILNNNTILPIDCIDKFILNKKGTGFSKQLINFGYKTTNTGESYLFDTKGKMYKINNCDFDMNSMNPLTYGTELVCATNALEKQYLVTVTKLGIVKKTPITEYLKISKATQAVKIREEDSLVYVGYADDEDFLYILGEQGKLVKISIKDITITGKSTIGSKGISDNVISATIAKDKELLFTYSNGKAKYTIGSEYNATAKGSKGQVVTEESSIIKIVKDNYYIIEKDIKIEKYNLNSLSVKSKTATGAKISEEKIIKVIV